MWCLNEGVMAPSEFQMGPQSLRMFAPQDENHMFMCFSNYT
jgi:hypothetical protein